VRAYVANHDIRELEDLERLFRGAQIVSLADHESRCDTYEGKVTTCGNEIEQPGLYVRYVFNSQNGGLELRDMVTGQENNAGWLNQYDITKSGYLPLSVDLVNRRGGLTGNPRMFQITADCSAAGDEWDGD
jgi:hypothetical protein